MPVEQAILESAAEERIRLRGGARVILAALTLRLVVGLALAAWETTAPTPLHPDSRYYHGMAPVTSLWGQLCVKWDSYWYLHIAAQGYAAPLDDTDQSPTAFAPLYPAAMRLLAGLGISPPAAGVLLALLCFVATLHYLYRFGCLVHSERMGAALVLLFSAFPSAWVLTMVYTESLFCLILAAFFTYYLQGRYRLAGLCAALLPFVRVAGIVVLPAILADLACRSRRSGRLAGGGTALLGAVCGIAALFAFYAVAAGRATAFLGAGEAWFARAGVAGRLAPLLHSIPLRLQDDPLAPLFVAFLGLYTVLGLWLWLGQRDIASWFSAFYLLMLLQTPILSAQMRYLLPLLPLHVAALVPLLRRPRLAATLLAVLLLIQVVLSRGYLAWSVII